MALTIETLLLAMREHQHLPGMPRIHGTTAIAACLHCGEHGLVEEGADGEALPESRAGAALFDDCPVVGVAA